MKRYLKKLSPLIWIALFIGVIWMVFQVTAEYPILGEPVSYPVNQLDGFELSIDEPGWTPFRGYTIRYKIQYQSEEIYQLIQESGKDYCHLDKLVDGQWYRMEQPEAIPDIINGTLQIGGWPAASAFSATFTQDFDRYGTRLEPGTYRLVLELTADEGTPHYLAAEFDVKNSINIR